MSIERCHLCYGDVRRECLLAGICVTGQLPIPRSYWVKMVAKTFAYAILLGAAMAVAAFVLGDFK